MNTFDAAKIRGVLEAGIPVPAEEYASAFYYQSMIPALEDLVGVYKTLFMESVEEIQASGMLSDEFVLRLEEKKNKSVNVPLLREELPDLFAEVAFVPTSDASKLLSKKFIYAEVKRLIKERITHYEEVTMKDLEARLPEPEFSRYVFEKSVSQRFVIEERGEDADKKEGKT